jgi:Tol biopolymer transport system component
MTKDETYLYFSLDPDCELIEPGFVISVSMFRMNLLNGEVSEVLKAFYDFETYIGNYYSASISPTGRRIAYIYPQESPLTLNISDLQTGETRLFPLEEKYGSGGMFSWSEDGTKLVFMLESEKDYDHLISMVFLDLLRNDSMVTFIQDKEFRWISSKLEVMNNGINVFPVGDTPMFYDIETGILSPIIP